jgi:hypothetical protein
MRKFSSIKSRRALRFKEMLVNKAGLTEEQAWELLH